MVFSSTIFVFGFLPLTLAGALLLQKHLMLQNYFLLVMSLLFYAWGEPKCVLLMLLSIVFNWRMALAVEASEGHHSRRNFYLGLTVVFNLGCLFAFKYFFWCISILNGMLHCDIPVRDIALPIGISFYTFQALSYVIDVWRKDVKARKDLLGVGMYISFFPQLIAGPIVRYSDIEKQLSDRTITVAAFSDGITRFLFGFIKKALLADNVAVIANKAFDLEYNNELGGAMAWLGAISYTFQIFCDFSGYSDMAIGLGKMLGFSLLENFNYPYKAVSIRDFWRRWHISLSGWFRDYVYIPLGGSRKGEKRTYLNLAIVWLLTGIWHGANVTFVFWGMMYGALIIVERLLRIEDKIRHSRIIRIGYRLFTCLAVIVLWVFFRAENIAQAFSYVAAMFDFKHWLDNIELASLYLSEFKWELAGCVLCSFVNVQEWFERESGLSGFVKMFVLYALFFVSISYLVKGTYSPFLYFNF